MHTQIRKMYTPTYQSESGGNEETTDEIQSGAVRSSVHDRRVLVLIIFSMYECHRYFLSLFIYIFTRLVRQVFNKRWVPIRQKVRRADLAVTGIRDDDSGGKASPILGENNVLLHAGMPDFINWLVLKRNKLDFDGILTLPLRISSKRKTCRLPCIWASYQESRTPLCQRQAPVRVRRAP